MSEHLVDLTGDYRTNIYTAARTPQLVDRGRSAPHGVPPAKIRTGGFPAYGSHLGCLTAKRSLGQG